MKEAFILYNKYNQASMVRILHIRLGGLELRHQNGFEESYFSLTHEDKYYFSSTFDHRNTRLQDDILIELKQNTIPESIHLQRWENCMIVFAFQVEIPQLRSRNFTKKKVETKWQQFLSMDFMIYEQKDIVFTDKYAQNISPHYLIIEDLFFTAQKHQARGTKQPNYFTITTKNSNYIIPVRQAVVLVKLPDSLEIKSFINNVFNGKSGMFNHSKLINGEEISIDKDGKSSGKVRLKVRWAINLHRSQVDQNLLLQSNQLMLYDFQFKFDNPSDVVGCKFKITHGGKAFEFAQDIDKSKTTKIKKIVHFIIKSSTQEINFILTKGGKIFTFCRFNSSQIGSNKLTNIKKKWPDLMNPAKFYGFIKVRAERARNLSVPQSNKFWREVLRRKHSITNMMISIHQPSVYFQENDNLTLVAKIQNDQKMINPLTNINFFDNQDEPTRTFVQFSVKGEESLYLIVKSEFKGNDFLGIGVMNTTDLRLGTNLCEVPFFKNQQKAGILNCIINKLVFWPFLKPLFQSQTQLQTQQNIWIDIFFNNIMFSPYFYTYRYDSKQEVYCIVEVNKTKKVLILQNTEHDKLSFYAAAGSDVLNFSVDQSDVVKIKISFLVSDLGHEEEIYGTAMCKVKASQVVKETIRLKNMEIVNDYSVTLGNFSLQVTKTIGQKSTPSQKAAEHDKPRHGSFDLSQASFDTHILPKKSGTNPSRRYSGGSKSNSSQPVSRNYLKKNTHPGKNAYDVKLPIIKQRKDKDSFTDLLHMMKVRKRQVGGVYEEKGLGSPKTQRQVRHERHSFDLKRLQQSNPNLDRNLEILFPKKGNQKFIQMNRSSKLNDYEERLKGLKSVMNEISDIGQVQPSIRESRHESRNNENTYQNEEYYQPEPEWEGNQFVQP